MAERNERAKLSRDVTPIFGFVVLILAWSAGWTIRSRVFGGEGGFFGGLFSFGDD